MSEGVPRYRTRPQTAAGEAAITPADIVDLRRLYDELPEATAAAAEVLNGRLTSVALARFRQLNARVIAIVERIEQIVAAADIAGR